MEYFVLKWIHIVSSTVLFGTGIGIAFFMLSAHRTGNAAYIAQVAKHVVLADKLFTAPAVIIQLLSGLWLVDRLGLPYSTFWIASALLLYVLIGACWLPVLYLQAKARDLAAYAAHCGEPLSAKYFQTMRWWFWLGWPAFISLLAIFWLMIRKPY